MKNKNIIMILNIILIQKKYSNIFNKHRYKKDQYKNKNNMQNTKNDVQNYNIIKHNNIYI